MKKYIYIGLAVLLSGLVVLAVWQGASLKKARAERDRYHRNSDALLTEVERYKIQDSISVARAEGLELTLKEYKLFRAEDAELIKSLRTKVKNLQSVSKTTTVTEYVMSAPVHDTVVVFRDSLVVPAKVVHCGDAWYDFYGYVTDSTFDGKMSSRDSITVVEGVEYARFLGFLWRTKRVKSRTIEVLNKNPHSTVENTEFITIKR